MKNILVLTDLSPRSEQISRVALKLAKQLGAGLLLCDVLSSPLKNAIHFYSNDYWPFEDDCQNVEELVNHLNLENVAGNMDIHCVNFDEFYPDRIKETITNENICMVMMAIEQISDLKTDDEDNYARQIIDQANCPVFLIPDGADINELDKIAYLTDLRYCDIQVVNLLKALNATVFVTHVSAWGTPDMNDAYAQAFLTDEIAANIDYGKLFLRNIKGENRKTDLDHIVLNSDIKAIAIVNKKHQMLDKFIQTEPGKERAYHQLPLLIVPYMDRNW
ncbi:universal stress protein [Mucilaginibacter sp. HMF5004]|uniref:universal stress protein n=1 Tax=Mucilaginibacter rivuli TaxID=2857527 RepID=UPI001C5D396F|nr:universal stress protein [Mucilaginibacter rivuli]MBW4889911.1 universal stress protein [Mucilaginibacter rivuli]